MQPAPIPENEEQRLESLHELALLDTEPEERFDRITRTATKIFKVPISTLTLIDSKREWFKSCEGLPEREGDRAISFCGHALVGKEDVFIIPDTTKDPRFADNPMVTGSPYIRFYAGVPLQSADGQRVGVFCIKDTKPHDEFSKEEQEMLKGLAQWAELEINSRNLSLALSERRKAQEKLEDAKAKDDAILASVGEGLIVIDGEGNVVTMSAAAGTMLGIRRNEFTGKHFTEISSMEDENGKELSLEERPIQAALTGKKIATDAIAGSYYFVRRDGTKFPAAVDAAPVVLNDKIVGAVDVFRDITKEKEIDRAKSEFLSLASHQLRTPPTIINWYTEILGSGDLGPMNEKQTDYIAEISKANKRMIAIINALLNISRIELNTFMISVSKTDIKKLIDDAIEEQTGQLKRKIEIIKNYDSTLGSFDADPNLMHIILDNLIVNAIKYSPATDAKIEIGAKTEGDALLITVKDNGIGIPKENQGRVFEKMFRADNAVSVDPNGTGLGLYMVKRIVDTIEGKIWFESKESAGTTFYLSLPLAGMKQKSGTTKLVRA